MNFDWAKPVLIDWSGRRGPLITEHDVKNSVIKRVLQNQYYAPFCEKEYNRLKPWWEPQDPFKTQNGKSIPHKHALYIPGMDNPPVYPRQSSLTKHQHWQGVRVLSAQFEYVQPTYYPKPTQKDYKAFEEFKELYEAEQKEFIKWAKLVWINGACIRALRPKPTVERVYEAEFKMRAFEMQSMPQNYTLAAQIPLETKNIDFELEYIEDLINVDPRDLPMVEYPEEMEKEFSILLKSCPVPEPCAEHPCKFVLPHEDTVSVLPLSELHRELAQYAIENGSSFVASENALRCLLETDRSWNIPVSVVEVICPDSGDLKTVIVLGSEFGVQKECSRQRTYRAYKHLLRHTFAPSTGNYKSKKPTEQSTPPKKTTLDPPVTKESNAPRNLFVSLDDLEVSSDEDDIDKLLIADKPKQINKPTSETDIPMDANVPSFNEIESNMYECIDEPRSEPDQLTIDVATESNTDFYEPDYSKDVSPSIEPDKLINDNGKTRPESIFCLDFYDPVKDTISSYNHDDSERNKLAKDISKTNGESIFGLDFYEPIYSNDTRPNYSHDNNESSSKPDKVSINDASKVILDFCSTNYSNDGLDDDEPDNEPDQLSINDSDINSELLTEPNRPMVNDPSNQDFEINYSNETRPTHYDDNESDSEFDRLSIDSASDINTEPVSEPDRLMIDDSSKVGIKSIFGTDFYKPIYSNETRPNYSHDYDDEPNSEPDQLYIDNASNINSEQVIEANRLMVNNTSNVDSKSSSQGFYEPNYSDKNEPHSKSDLIEDATEPNQVINDCKNACTKFLNTSKNISTKKLKTSEYAFPVLSHTNEVYPMLEVNEEATARLLDTKQNNTPRLLQTNTDVTSSLLETAEVAMANISSDVQVTTDVKCKVGNLEHIDQASIMSQAKVTEPTPSSVDMERESVVEILNQKPRENLKSSSIKPCRKKVRNLSVSEARAYIPTELLNIISPYKNNLAKQSDSDDVLKENITESPKASPRLGISGVITRNRVKNNNETRIGEPTTTASPRLGVSGIVTRNKSLAETNKVLGVSAHSETFDPIKTRRRSARLSYNAIEISEPTVKINNPTEQPSLKLVRKRNVTNNKIDELKEITGKPQTSLKLSPVKPCSVSVEEINIQTYIGKRISETLNVAEVELINEDANAVLKPGPRKPVYKNNITAVKSNEPENIEVHIKNPPNPIIGKQSISESNTDVPELSEPVFEKSNLASLKTYTRKPVFRGANIKSILKPCVKKIINLRPLKHRGISSSSISKEDTRKSNPTNKRVGKLREHISQEQYYWQFPENSKELNTIEEQDCCLFSNPAVNFNDDCDSNQAGHDIPSLNNHVNFGKLSFDLPSESSMFHLPSKITRTKPGKRNFSELFGDDSDSDESICNISYARNSKGLKNTTEATKVDARKLSFSDPNKSSVEKPLKPCLKNNVSTPPRNSKRTLSFSDPLISDPELCLSASESGSEDAIAGFHNGVAVLCTKLSKKQKNTVTCSYGLRSRNKAKTMKSNEKAKTTVINKENSSTTLKVPPKSNDTKSVGQRNISFSDSNDSNSDYSKCSRRNFISSKVKNNTKDTENTGLRRSRRISMCTSTEDSDNSLLNKAKSNDTKSVGQRKISFSDSNDSNSDYSKCSRRNFISSKVKNNTKNTENTGLRRSRRISIRTSTEDSDNSLLNKAKTNDTKSVGQRKISFSDSNDSNPDYSKCSRRNFISSKVKNNTKNTENTGLRRSRRTSMRTSTEDSDNSLSNKAKNAKRNANTSNTEGLRRSRRISDRSTTKENTQLKFNMKSKNNKFSKVTKKGQNRRKSLPPNLFSEKKKTKKVNRSKSFSNLNEIGNTNTRKKSTPFTNRVYSTRSKDKSVIDLKLSERTKRYLRRVFNFDSSDADQSEDEMPERSTRPIRPPLSSAFSGTEQSDLEIKTRTKKYTRKSTTTPYAKKTNKSRACANNTNVTDELSDRTQRYVRHSTYSSCEETDQPNRIRRKNTKRQLQDIANETDADMTDSRAAENIKAEVMDDGETEQLGEDIRDLIYNIDPFKIEDAAKVEIILDVPEEISGFIDNKRIEEPNLNTTATEMDVESDTEFYNSHSNNNTANTLSRKAIHEIIGIEQAEPNKVRHTGILKHHNATQQNNQTKPKSTGTPVRSRKSSISSDSSDYFDIDETDEMNIFHFTAAYDSYSESEEDLRVVEDSQSVSNSVVMPEIQTVENQYDNINNKTSDIAQPRTSQKYQNDITMDASSKIRQSVTQLAKEIVRTDAQTEHKGNTMREAKGPTVRSFEDHRNKDSQTLAKEINDTIGVYNCTCKGTRFEVPPPRSFKKWRVRNKNSNVTFDLIVHSSHRVRKENREVLLEPIVEYQPELGGCRPSAGWSRALALQLALRDGADLINVRVHHDNGNVIVLDHVTGEEFVRRHGDKRGEIADTLHTTLDQLRFLRPGQYVLAHDPSHGTNAMLYTTKGAHDSAATLNLRRENINMPDAEDALYVKVPPELDRVVLPYHKHRAILPLAFTPHRVHVKEDKRMVAALAKAKHPPNAIQWPKKKKKRRPRRNRQTTQPLE